MPFNADEHRYETMTYRRTGQSGVRLPEISLGFWQNFGGQTGLETQRAIARRAFDLGITHFDFANNYGPPAGSAELNFGQILDDDFRPYRDELFISSKAGYYMWPGPYGEWGSRKYILSSLDQSLKRLRLDYVDLFYSHRFDPDTPLEETAGALATAVQSGKALYVGISNYSPEHTAIMARLLAEHKIHLLIHQPSFSMFNRHVERGLLPVLDEAGMGAIVFSPLAQGTLTDRYLGGSIAAGTRAARNDSLRASIVGPTYAERANGLKAIAEARGQTLSQLAITWVLRHPQITSALVGASSVAQIEENARAAGAAPLTDEELTAIEQFAVDGTKLSD